MMIVFVFCMHIQNTIPIRGDPHVLVVGDPGLGKSQVSRNNNMLTLAICRSPDLCPC